MKLTNDSYVISIGTRNFTERYYRDRTGWLKISARGRTFRLTAEQVLNHLLPALAGLKPKLIIRVEHHEPPAAPPPKPSPARAGVTGPRAGVTRPISGRSARAERARVEVSPVRQPATRAGSGGVTRPISGRSTRRR